MSLYFVSLFLNLHFMFGIRHLLSWNNVGIELSINFTNIVQISFNLSEVRDCLCNVSLKLLFRFLFGVMSGDMLLQNTFFTARIFAKLAIISNFFMNSTNMLLQVPFIWADIFAKLTLMIASIFMNSKNMFLQITLTWTCIIAKMAYRVLDFFMNWKNMFLQKSFICASKFA